MIDDTPPVLSTRAPVLVAEDDPLSRRILLKVLRENGHPVIEAADGNLAWEVCRGDDPPRIVILDWMMPGLTGIEVCQRLRAQTERPYTIVILITAKNRHQDMLEGFAAGVDDFITKPFSPDQLVARIRAAERMLAVAGGAGLASALREAEASPGGDLLIRDRATVGRVLFHEGKVAWIHLSSSPGSLVEVLAGRVPAEDVRAVLAEAAASGRNFAEVLVDWDLMAEDELRTQIRDWLRAKLKAVLALDPWLVMFVPQKRGHNGDLTFSLAELMPAAAPVSAPATAPVVATHVLAEVEATPQVTTVLHDAASAQGVLAAAVFDVVRGICVGRRGTPVDLALVVALTRLPYHEAGADRVEELLVTRGRRYHLLGATRSPRYFIYLELDRHIANLGQARILLRNIAERVVLDG